MDPRSARINALDAAIAAIKPEDLAAEGLGARVGNLVANGVGHRFEADRVFEVGREHFNDRSPS